MILERDEALALISGRIAAAADNGFPVTSISEVSVLDPYFYVGNPS